MVERIKYIVNSNDFSCVPGNPIAYWLSNKEKEAFITGSSLSEYANCCTGMQTGNNEKYIRMWQEVSIENTQLVNDHGKWFRYNCGGESRKWYGNYLNLVNWQNDGSEIRHEKSSVIRNQKQFFKKGITWKRISSGSFSFRLLPAGFIFDQAGDSMFAKDERRLLYVMSFVNSKVAYKLSECISPTLNLTAGNMVKMPLIIQDSSSPQIESYAENCIEICKEDWDSAEISWDFKKSPLVGGINMGRLISDKFKEWEEECQKRFDKLKANEVELNRIFINIYGLQDELTPEVEDKDITVRLADKERDIRSLISYLVGIAMGRYSLDVPGLAFAGGEWDASKYVTYQPDDDGIIPIYNGIGMEDGLTTILINLIKQIYGEDTYRQNIDFIAEALGKNNNESSEETLNRYLNDGFYADHLKTYQKRPIYWLFTSGKKAGFKCLIYMHRYNEDTLARINAKYFLPESTRKKNELDELNGRIAHAEGRDKLRLEKARQNLAAAYNEAIEYGQVLDHMANQYISIDLDDGVKVNYAKFQGVEIVTDGGSKVKKDLLAPLK